MCPPRRGPPRALPHPGRSQRRAARCRDPGAVETEPHAAGLALERGAPLPRILPQAQDQVQF